MGMTEETAAETSAAEPLAAGTAAAAEAPGRSVLHEVRLFAAAAAALGTDLTTAPGATVAEVLDALCERADDDGARVIRRSSVLVDAVACRDHAAPLPVGARLDVLPPFAGG
ncbi:hypothetical protein GCM10027268_05450 [Brachybacterium huguangmaarense]